MKPKVLQLIGNLHAAGSERQAAQLAQSLHESKHYRVSVACMDPRGSLGEELNQAGFTEIPSFRMNSFYDHTMIVSLKRFARFLNEQKVDVVHTHDFYTNVFGMAGSWLAGVPVRIASRRETTGWRTPAQKFVERRAYQLAHAIVANAEAVSQHLVKEGVRKERVVTIYNGLDLKRVTPQFNRQETFKRLNVSSNGHHPLVTIVANLLHPVKDYPTFLRAAQRVHQDFPNARFIAAGDGPLKDRMVVHAKELGLEHCVNFIGRCEYVADLLSISDVCVLSSIAEGFSNSIIEYMGAGRPVVATDVGGAREAVIEGETGYLVQPRNFQTMAERIVDLLRNPERARAMGRYGRQVVESKFSCAAQLDRTVELYERLLERVKTKSALASRRIFFTLLVISVFSC
jgi:L-malate glycosyltransferase